MSAAPIIGILASVVVGALMRPKVPKPPSPAPAPPAPAPAPLPEPPKLPEPEPTISPSDSQANTKAQQDARKRRSSAATDKPLGEEDGSTVGFKSLLGE